GAPAAGRHAAAWAPEDTARARTALGGSPLRVSPLTGANWQDFLRQVTALGLTGQSGDHSGPPRVPLPVHARALLARLWDGGYAEVADFVAALEHAEFRPAAIPQARRVATLLIPAVWPALTMLVTLIQSGAQYPAWFQDLIGDRPFYVKALHDSTTPRPAKDAIEVVLASALAAARATPRLGEQMLSFMSAADRALLDTLAQRHPGVTTPQADTARAWLTAHRTAWMDAIDIRKIGFLGRLAVALLQLGTFGVAAVVLALMLRGPPLLHLAGISVTRNDGAPAGRLRCALRSGLAWAPWIALFFAHRAPFAVQIALAALGAAGVAYSLANPDRGVSDRIMGTVLVPK
ncbi:MAG TPA: hypothetical protein VFJ24_05075, partial [Gaiellales bacterium]|nr:hypothetical protein [Gaiellales bacterium]